MRVIWQDQAEYYFVCDHCYTANRNTQWSGSTSVKDWPRHRAYVEARAARMSDNDCEFCGPDGNGGFASDL